MASQSRLTTFNSGVDVEEQVVTWNITNFSLLRHHRAQVESQTVGFRTVVYPARWSLSLRVEEDGEGHSWIGLYLGLTDSEQLSSASSPAELQSSRISVTFELIGAVERGPTIMATSLDIFHDESPSPPFCSFPRLMTTDGESLADHLLIFIRVQISTPVKVVEVRFHPARATLLHFQARSKERAVRLLSVLLRSAVPLAVVTLVSGEGTEFTVLQSVLMAQSPVFEAMLNTDMLERNTGIVRLSDISTIGLRVLLTYLLDGELLPEWKDGEILVEMTYSAGKYMLEELLDFLDKVIGCVVQLSNAGALAFLVRLLGLKDAEQGILTFVRLHGFDDIESLICLCGGSISGDDNEEEGQDDEEADGPLSKRQKIG